MKFKTLILGTIFFTLSIMLFPEVPERLQGIWQGDDRIIFLNEDNEIAVILKEYYGWYYDRAVEPANFRDILPRSRNIATQKEAYDYTVEYQPLPGTENGWEITINMDKKTKSIIPVAVLGDDMYISFLLKVPYDTTQEMDTPEELTSDPFYGYWQGMNCAESIRIAPRKNAENLVSWYITEHGVYRLRFWETGMKYENSSAVFSDMNKLFTVNKHIYSAGNNYSCVNGRSSNIRNVEKFPDFPFQYKLDEEGTVCALGKPFLKKVKDADTKEKLMEIVKEANSRRKPDPEPLFPVKLHTFQ